MEKLGEIQKSIMDEIKIIHHPSPRNDHIFDVYFPNIFFYISIDMHTKFT